jgi:hypothetical protein
VVEFTHTAHSSASADAVLAGARDFTRRRIEIWPNVSPKRYEVHAEGETFAEVTEGALRGVFWERSRYEWGTDGSVHQTVLDSNVLAPGSTWELVATPNGDGCHVETAFRREFRRTPKGWFGRLVNSRAGRWLYGMDFRKMLANVEKG